MGKVSNKMNTGKDDMDSYKSFEEVKKHKFPKFGELPFMF